MQIWKHSMVTKIKPLGLCSFILTGLATTSWAVEQPPRLCYDNVPAANLWTVTPLDIEERLVAVECGDELLMTQGNYGSLTLVKTCPAGKPMRLRGQDGVIINGDLIVNGSAWLLHGITLARGSLTIKGNENRVTRSQFRSGTSIQLSHGAASNRIDHNDFTFSQKDDLPFQLRNNVGRNNRIDGNYWTTNGPGGGGIGLYVGQFSARKGYARMARRGDFYTLIENNLWENFGRNSAIEVKSNRNIIRNNSFVNSSRIVQRHGHNNLYERNYFENVTQGLMIREQGNIAVGNHFQGAWRGRETALRVMAGERDMTGVAPQYRDWLPEPFQVMPIPQGAPAVGTELRENVGPLVIGDVFEERTLRMPALMTRVFSHDGRIERKHEEMTVIKTGAASSKRAQKLSRSEVGRQAPLDEDCR